MSPSTTSRPRPRPGPRTFAGATALLAALLAPPSARAQEPAAPAAASTAEPAASAAAPAADTAASAAATTGVKPEPSAAPEKRAHRGTSDLAPPSAFNPFHNPVRWDPSWPKFGIGEYITTGVMGAAVFAAKAIPPTPDNWRATNGFDSAARDAIRLRSAGERNTADDASDLILALMVNQLVIDATLVAWWGHDRPSVAWQMVLIDLEALALTGGLQALVSAAVSRWRPFRDKCVNAGPEETQDADCATNKEFTSFWSGHTSGAFTVAGLMCMHHAHLPLYGGGAREKAVCAASFAAAATVGMLRIASDNHYLSDVLVGAGIGTMVGLGVPWLFHYRGGADVDAAGRERRGNQVSFRLSPMPMGIGASGEF